MVDDPTKILKNISSLVSEFKEKNIFLDKNQPFWGSLIQHLTVLITQFGTKDTYWCTQKLIKFIADNKEEAQKHFKLEEAEEKQN